MLDAVFLDCDGVVTDRRARVDARVMFEAYRLAHSGKRIAFATGRSIDWLLRNIVPEIERLNPTPAERVRFFFIAECGNRWATFSGGGISTGGDDSHAVPNGVRDAIRREAGRFPLVFFDETKESLVSLEIRHERMISAQAEKEAGKQLDDARALFASKYPELTVTRTLYAVDVMGKGVGKASAARRALELAGRVSHALVMGDSPIDVEMGEELARRGVAFDFYYVGETPPPHTAFAVKRSAGRYSEGALEVLRNVR